MSSKEPLASSRRLGTIPSSTEPPPTDSGSGGMGGTAALRVGRCGELIFLEEGEPGSILLKLYDENRLEARRSSGSWRDSAASVDLVSGGTSGMRSTGSGGVVRSVVSGMEIDSDGRLRTGKEGARLDPEATAGRSSATTSSASSSGRVDIRLGGVRFGGERIGEPLVMSESAENRDTGRGLPKLSRLKRSGRGGVGLTVGGGARTGTGMGMGEGEEVEETGPSVNWCLTRPSAGGDIFGVKVDAGGVPDPEGSIGVGVVSRADEEAADDLRSRGPSGGLILDGRKASGGAGRDGGPLTFLWDNI